MCRTMAVVHSLTIVLIGVKDECSVTTKKDALADNRRAALLQGKSSGMAIVVDVSIVYMADFNEVWTQFHFLN
jgi:hypothetical protein